MENAIEHGGVSRRTFLKGMALGGVAAASAATLNACAPAAKGDSGASADGQAAAGEPSFMTPPEPVADADIGSTKETDVLIIGAGIAGCVTAASCIENGLSVMLIDKLKQPRYIGIDFGFPYSKVMREEGIEPVDPYVLARDFIMKSGHRTSDAVVYRYMTRGEEAADWFVDKVAAWGFHPSVMGYRGKDDFYPNHANVIRFLDETNEKPEEYYGIMKAFLENFGREVVDSGNEYLLETNAVQLDQAEDGSITGAVCRAQDGSYFRVNAAKGVVLCTGDYGADEEMFLTYSEWKPEDIDCNESTGLGEGHKMGLWVGAQMQRAPHPMMLFHDAHVYHYLRVNKHGQRYVNEDAGYCGSCVAQLRQPEHLSWAIFDGKWKEEIPASLEFGGGMAWDQGWRSIHDPWTPEVEEEVFEYEKEEGYWYESDTIEGLADELGFAGQDKQTFIETVARYNELVEKGVDEDFGKRPELLKLSALTTPPFVAKKMITDIGVSTGGLMTDADMRILDNEGMAIPGLFGVGTVTGSMFGVDYNEMTIPGVSLGRNVTFGWLLGRHLAEAR